MPQVFDTRNDKWTKEYEELKDLLTEEEYKAGRASTQNAHYTSPTIIKGIYEALDRMGYKKGRALELRMKPAVKTQDCTSLRWVVWVSLNVNHVV